VSESAVCKARKVLSRDVVKTVQLEAAHEVVRENLDMVAQLRKINDAINIELDAAREAAQVSDGKDRVLFAETIARLSAEVRKQLKSQLEIFAAWHDAKVIADFQEVVLEVLSECDPALRNEAVRRLKERNALRGSLTIR
jgi:predicted outer membrane protein